MTDLPAYPKALRSVTFAALVALLLTGCSSDGEAPAPANETPSLPVAEASIAPLSPSLLERLDGTLLLNAVAAVFDDSDRERVALFYRTGDDSTRLSLVADEEPFAMRTLDLALSPQTQISDVDRIYSLTTRRYETIRLPYSFLTFAAEDDVWRSVYAYDLARDRFYFATQRKSSSSRVIESSTRFHGVTRQMEEAIRLHLRRQLGERTPNALRGQQLTSIVAERPVEQGGSITLSHPTESESMGTYFQLDVHDEAGGAVQQLVARSNLMDYQARDTESTCSLQPRWQDINFDTYGDLELCDAQAAGGQTNWKYYLYYPRLEAFVYKPDFFMQGGHPDIDAEQRTITTRWHVGTGYRRGTEVYGVDGNRLVLQRRTLVDDNQGIDEVYERRGAEMVLVERNGEAVRQEQEAERVAIHELLGVPAATLRDARGSLSGCYSEAGMRYCRYRVDDRTHEVFGLKGGYVVSVAESVTSNSLHDALELFEGLSTGLAQKYGYPTVDNQDPTTGMRTRIWQVPGSGAHILMCGRRDDSDHYFTAYTTVLSV